MAPSAHHQDINTDWSEAVKRLGTCRACAAPLDVYWTWEMKAGQVVSVERDRVQFSPQRKYYERISMTCLNCSAPISSDQRKAIETIMEIRDN